MNVKEFKNQIATNLNYKFNEGLNIVHGKSEGYTSIIAPIDQYESSYSIIYCVSKDGSTLNKDEFSVLKADKKLITNIRVNNNRVAFIVKGDRKQDEKMNNIIEANKSIVKYLKENNYKNIDENTKELADTIVCNVQGSAQFITASTLEKLKNEHSGDNVIKKEENVIKGIIGGILGSLVGVLAIVLIGQLGYIAIISGIVMGVCTILAYNKLAGAISKKGIIISIVIMAIMTYIGVRLDVTFIINNELSKYGSNLSFGQIFENVPNIVKMNTELESAYMRDMVLTYVFTAIGAFGIIKTKFDEIGNKNVFEIL